MIRSWLDPRTQQKIEIVPQTDSLKRLHELIALEYLPPEYGGTAPDLYYEKPDTDYVVLEGGEEVQNWCSLQQCHYPILYFFVMLTWVE